MQDYQQLLGFIPEEVEATALQPLAVAKHQQKLYFKELNNWQAFTDPFRAIAGQSFIYSTYTSITHGDLNQHNLLIDAAGYPWLIDFQDTGRGHILHDIAELDAVVRFQLLTAEEATLEERAEIEKNLCTPHQFSQLVQLADSIPTKNKALARAYTTVIHLRTLANQLVARNRNNDMSEYYVALLYNALNTLRFLSLSTLQREHALLSASLLADRLGLQS